jgi:hypothetical protein
MQQMKSFPAVSMLSGVVLEMVGREALSELYSNSIVQYIVQHSTVSQSAAVIYSVCF